MVFVLHVHLSALFITINFPFGILQNAEFGTRYDDQKLHDDDEIRKNFDFSEMDYAIG